MVEFTAKEAKQTVYEFYKNKFVYFDEIISDIYSNIIEAATNGEDYIIAQVNRDSDLIHAVLSRLDLDGYTVVKVCYPTRQPLTAKIHISWGN